MQILTQNGCNSCSQQQTELQVERFPLEMFMIGTLGSVIAGFLVYMVLKKVM